ncbi:MAG: hypothetical protein V1899_05815 [Planctomycetota bacterium]
MPMDATDKRLVNVLIWFTVFGLLTYFIPGFGYRAMQEEEEKARELLKPPEGSTHKSWVRYYSPMHPAHYGEIFTDTPPPETGVLLSDLKTNYERNNQAIQQQIKTRQSETRIHFPDWTEIPEKYRDKPGYYWADIWEKHRRILDDEWTRAKVECLEGAIGFGSYKGLIETNPIRAREFLRELYIAESVIRLCIKAKQEQEEYERLRFQPEAYMKIISIIPQESVATGPSELRKNPKFRAGKDERNAFVREYIAVPLGKFIQEYPVEIVLQCDINTFERFLYSVRTRDQFLIIRNLEIVSSYLGESKEDKSELTGFETKLKAEGRRAKDPSKDEHVFVRLSAAGMDFFDPETHPHGLGSAKEQTNTRTPRSRFK